MTLAARVEVPMMVAEDIQKVFRGPKVGIMDYSVAVRGVLF